MENLHAVGGDGFQHGDAGGQGGKNGADEEQRANDNAGGTHGGKYFGQGHEHQAGACAHAVGAGEHEHCGDNHDARQQRYAGIEKLNLVDGLVEIYVLLHIGAVGNHNAHGDAQGEEQLAHGVQQNLQKPPHGQPLYVGSDVIEKALKTGAHGAGRIGAAQGQGIDGDDHHQHQQYGHHDFRHLFNAALHTVIDDESRYAHKQQSENYRRDR